MTYWKVTTLAALALGVAHAGLAQQSVGYASVGGRVRDPSGAVVQGATVTARNVETGIAASVSSGDDGRFRIPYLRVGAYEIVVAQSGFHDVRTRLTLTAGAAFDLPVALSVQPLDASITVSGDATVLEASRSQIAGTLSQTEVTNLPLNGRNFLEAALLVPGVSPTNVNSSQLFPETSAVPGITLSVNSQRNLSNNFSVDGLSANDDAAGLSGITYGVDAIEQVQVVTSGGQAEQGRALGGYVNVITRSGTNVLHGTAYDFIRDDALNTSNPLTGSTLPMSQSQYGGSLGGPIVSSRTFYFGNVEQRRLDQSGLTTITAPNAAVVNARLRAVGYAAPLVETGVYASPVDTTNVLGKLDHQVSGSHQIGLRYSLYDVGSHNARGAGGLNAPSASSALDNLDQTLAFSSTLTLSPRTVLESRAQLAHSDLQAPPSDLVGPAVGIAGVASFGRLSSSPTGRVNTLVQVVNNLSHQAGAHAFRVGADFLFNDDRIVFPRSVRGSYSFSSLPNFLAGVYNNAGFTQTFGDTDVSQTNPNVGVYAQDEWKIGARVTLNAGLRYELQFLEAVDTDADNVSPRVGVAWVPFDTRRTVIRGSAGLFYDRVPLRAVANALLSAGNTTDLARLRQVNVSLSPTQAAAPVFPAILDRPVPSVTLANLTTMDRRLDNAYSRQAGVEIEQQVGQRGTLSVGYQYVGGRKLLMAINQNVPACPPSGTNNGCRPNPAYANNNQYSAAGRSVYHGLHVSFAQRPAGWGHYRVSYTLSTSKNDVGEFFFSSPIDPFDLSRDWGRSDDDQRHRLVVYGAVQSPEDAASSWWDHLTHGFRLSGMVQSYSALPYNITSGVTTLYGTPGRPIVDGEFIPRNSGVGTTYLNVSARLARRFRLTNRVDLEALAEGFNLTDHTNVLTRNTNFGAGAYPTNPLPSFGQITAVSEPRSFQLGARLSF